MGENGMSRQWNIDNPMEDKNAYIPLQYNKNHIL